MWAPFNGSDVINIYLYVVIVICVTGVNANIVDQMSNDLYVNR